MNNYASKKNAAFGLIQLVGLGYLATVLILTVKILPVISSQAEVVGGLISVQCSPQTLLTTGGLYVAIGLGLLLSILWLKVIWAVFKAIKSLYDTNRFITKLELIQIAANTYEINSPEAQVFTAGLFLPRIYISKSLYSHLSEQEFQSVLNHELNHVQARDPLRKLLVDFVKHILPYFPTKRSVFHNYAVLSELSADEYAAERVASKRGIVSALEKMFALAENDLNISSFTLRSDRIRILVGREQFKTKQFFSLITAIGMLLLINSLALSQTDMLVNCRQFADHISRLVTPVARLQLTDFVCRMNGVPTTDLQSEIPGEFSSTPQISSF
jgi:Zn-dependent protease with chaperone function